SHFEFGVMAALSRQPDRSLQLKDLAVVANGSLSRLSHVISRLERRGWGGRTSGTNGRAMHAELTKEGYRKLMAAGPIHFQEVRRLVFDVLTPEEVRALDPVSARINAGLLGGISLGALARRTRERAVRSTYPPAEIGGLSGRASARPPVLGIEPSLHYRIVKIPIHLQD